MLRKEMKEMTEEEKKKRLAELESQWEACYRRCRKYWQLWRLAGEELNKIKKEIDNL